MSDVFAPVETVRLAVSGGGQFPVHQIFCVGRNYADHAVEMGHDPTREAPFFFLKPDWSILPDQGEMQYPGLSQDVHHEVELVVALQGGGENIPVDQAESLIFGYGVGIDMTRRDLQAEAKDKSRPWDAGKSFRHAAPCSDITPVSQTGILNQGEIILRVNGDIRQQGDLNQMIWKVPEVISRLSELFPLYPGDLIFTGTPAGVGPIEKGDVLEAEVQGLLKLQVTVV
ncbi:MAG: fumarylacetoacetate hydrolase family protein [Pseudomonadales bacterium]|nr:fumarylacetoacetate hydrolase family protein [Pseudomonadales bacterium]